MAQPLEHIEYLSKEIGARPAGTEEEQNAALYIADQLKKEAGYHAEIEEFTGSSNFPYVRAICSGVIILVTILAMITPVLAIPAFVLSLVAAAIYILEAFDKPFITRALARSASQNVVAKYQPNAGDGAEKGSSRSRKIVLVARYDSGKVTPALIKRIESMGLPLGLICMGAAALATIFLLIRIFLGSVGGVGIVVFNVVSIIVLLAVALPLVRTIMVQLAPYNEGANSNASGVAAILEVARRISRGSVSEADLVDEPEGIAIHGEAAAIANGLVPEGAEIRYEAERLTPPEMEPLDDEERLLSAKAAIAAFTGQPVERKTYGSVASQLVNTRAEDFKGYEPVEVAVEDEQQDMVPSEEPVAFATEAPIDVPQQTTWSEPENVAEPVAVGFDNAPSWFVAAQQKAKKPTGETGPIQRSRYTDAIEAAEREALERELARQEEERARLEEARHAREQAMRASLAEAEQQRAAEEVREYELRYQSMPTTVADDAAEPAGFQAEGEVIEAPAISALPEIDQVQPGRYEVNLEAAYVSESTPDLTIAAAPISMADLAKELEEANAEPTYQPQVEVTPEDEAEPAVRQRISSLPAIEEEKPELEENVSPSRSGLFRMLRNDVPSLSGVIRMQEAGEDVSQVPAKRVDPTTIPSLSGPVAEQEAVDYDMEATYVEEPADQDEYGYRGWNGGGLSRVRLEHVDMRSGEESTADEPEEIEAVGEETDAAIADEIEKIYHFRNPLFNTEIWFVAIGCNTDYHDGALAFINEHQSELRGAMIVEVESLGSGDLSVASSEGRFFKVNASSRIKRFTRAAQAATGINLASVSLAGEDSIASVVQKAGLQSMHLFGADKGEPALKGSADDVLENIDEDVLDDNVNFLIELVKHN